MKKMKNCIICKNDYTAKVGNQKCCSLKCFKEWGCIKTKLSYENDKINSRKEADCIVCLRHFDYHYRKDRDERKFCGRSCAAKFYIKNGNCEEWRLRVNEKQERIKVICAFCEKEILVLKREFKEHIEHNMAFYVTNFVE